MCDDVNRTVKVTKGGMVRTPGAACVGWGWGWVVKGGVHVCVCVWWCEMTSTGPSRSQSEKGAPTRGQRWKGGRSEWCVCPGGGVR